MRDPNLLVPQERNLCIVIAGEGLAGHVPRQQAGIRQIALRVVVLMPILGPNILNIQHRLTEGLLNAEAELAAGRRLVVGPVQAGNVVNRDLSRIGDTGSHVGGRVRQ